MKAAQQVCAAIHRGEVLRIGFHVLEPSDVDPPQVERRSVLPVEALGIADLTGKTTGCGKRPSVGAAMDIGRGVLVRRWLEATPPLLMTRIELTVLQRAQPVIHLEHGVGEILRLGKKEGLRVGGRLGSHKLSIVMPLPPGAVEAERPADDVGLPLGRTMALADHQPAQSVAGHGTVAAIVDRLAIRCTIAASESAVFLLTGSDEAAQLLGLVQNVRLGKREFVDGADQQTSSGKVVGIDRGATTAKLVCWSAPST